MSFHKRVAGPLDGEIRLKRRIDVGRVEVSGNAVYLGLDVYIIFTNEGGDFVSLQVGDRISQVYVLSMHTDGWRAFVDGVELVEPYKLKVDLELPIAGGTKLTGTVGRSGAHVNFDLKLEPKYAPHMEASGTLAIPGWKPKPDLNPWRKNA